MRTFISLLCLAILFITVSQAKAQCADIRGVPVTLVQNAGLNDIARASLAPNGRPIVEYNPMVVAMATPQTRRFFYMHECGHHALGHVLNRLAMNAEQEADCFAIRTLVKNGEFSDSDVSVVQADIARAARGDWTHLPGPQRAINLRACLGDVENANGRSETDSEEMTSCLADRPAACVTACVTAFGMPRNVCISQMCAQSALNVQSWRRSCEEKIRKSKQSDEAEEAGSELGFNGVVKKYLDTSNSGYRSIRGERKSSSGDTIYRSTVTLPGMSDCDIWVTTSSSPYVYCNSEGSEDLSQITTDFEKLVSKLQAALSGWTKTESSNSSSAIKRVFFREQESEGRRVSVSLRKRTGTIARTKGTYVLVVDFHSKD